MRRRTFLTEDKNKYLDKYLTFIPLEDGTFTWNSPSVDNHEFYNNIEFSLDGGITWNALEHDTSTQTVGAGNEIMFKGLCKPFATEYEILGCGNFSSTCQFNVEGNIMSLLFGDDFKDKYTLINEDVQTSYRASHFRNLFSECNIVNAKNLMLPATELAEGCYTRMFEGCTSLTEAPELLATELAPYCYVSMFNECVSLTKAPELPATELAQYCYSSMFGICTSLTEAPELRVTILQSYCYNNMFSGCSSLTKAPELPATELAEGCYSYMFMDCASLTEAPELLATTLANECYMGMFNFCTSLIEAPELPATELASCCYLSMFEGCTNLIEAPELPATTLVDACYSNMFRECTSLTKAPELPAQLLTPSCYETMFMDCTSLNEVKCLALDMSAEYCTAEWMLSVGSSGKFFKAETAEWTRGTNGIPEGWSVLFA